MGALAAARKHLGPEESVDPDTLATEIVEDITSNRRPFLPGRACRPDEIISHFNDGIFIDGLSKEESYLVLSTLPGASRGVYLNPLDKGLSGSKVFAGRYEVDGHPKSKLFVFKLGKITQIEREHAAIEEFVRPHIHGVVAPVYRRGRTIGLIVQELSGLAAKSTLRSLKEHVRDSPDAAVIIERLLRERLGNWYQPNGAGAGPHRLDHLFKWYLRKTTGNDPFPKGWGELHDWVSSLTGLKCPDTLTSVRDLMTETITSPTTIVHGDLHAQNVLIDERGECWPIDFAWCHSGSSPVLDLTMLECSLKFLALPSRSDLRTLISVDHALVTEAFPGLSVGDVPYRSEIANVHRAVLAVRRFAMTEMNITFTDYQKALCLMTYAHSTHPKLNRPLVLASLEMLCAVREGVH